MAVKLAILGLDVVQREWLSAVEALRAGIEKDHPQAARTEWRIPTRLVVRQSTTFPRGTLPALVIDSSGKRRGAGNA